MTQFPGELEARVRAAQYEAERLHEIAPHTCTESILLKMRRRSIQLSPVVEDRLHLRGNSEHEERMAKAT